MFRSKNRNIDSIQIRKIKMRVTLLNSILLTENRARTLVVVLAFAGLLVMSVMAGQANAVITTISFLSADGLAGVDGGAIPPWSADNTTVNLGTSSWSLLGGEAVIKGFTNGSASNLTHRGVRGVGVKGQENDEVDFHDDPEAINIEFTARDYFINSLEIRSLFDPDTGWDDDEEEGAIDFYLDGTKFYTEFLSGFEEFQGVNGPVGSVVVNYAAPKLVDKLVYYIPTTDPGGNPLTNEIITHSEFAVAKLNVSPIPEPATICLLGLGSLSLILRRRRYPLWPRPR